MPSHARLIGGALALSLGVVACKGVGGTAADTSLARDLQLAARGAGQQQLKDAPDPTGMIASGRTTAKGTVAAGTTMIVHPAARVCTNTNHVGARLTATLADPIRGTNGATIPAGARVTMTIARLKRSENSRDPISMTLEVRSVSFGGKTYPLQATVTHENIERVRNEPKSKDVQKVVGGAVIGAIAGRIIGKSTKGAVIGGAAGAATGAGVAAVTANYEGCIARGSNVTVRLTAPVTIG